MLRAMISGDKFEEICLVIFISGYKFEEICLVIFILCATDDGEMVSKVKGDRLEEIG